MSSMLPIIMPVMHSSSPNKCPKCQEIENKKEVCGHCNYEYEEDGDGFFYYFIGCVISFAIFLSYFVITDGGFLMGCYNGCGTWDYGFFVFLSFTASLLWPLFWFVIVCVVLINLFV